MRRAAVEEGGTGSRALNKISIFRRTVSSTPALGYLKLENPDSVTGSQGAYALEEEFNAAFAEDQTHAVTVRYFTTQTTVVAVGMDTVSPVSTYDYRPRGPITVNGQAYVSADGVFEAPQVVDLALGNTTIVVVVTASLNITSHW